MTPMLRLVARAYAAEYRDRVDELSQMAFVFPNKRSATFFLRYLDLEINAPHIEPEVITIADLVASLSPLAEAPRFMQLATLYDAYRDIAPESVPDFDRFLFWGETILADFADVDRYLADPAALFSNVRELKEINSTYLTDLQLEIIRQYWGVEPGGINAFLYGEGGDDEARRFWTHVGAPESEEASRKFRLLWQVLAQLYDRFNAMLAADGYATSGRHYRDAAMLVREKGVDAFAFPATRYVFVGFNQLSPAEIIIFKELQKAGRADFYWDVASPMFKGKAASTAENPLRGAAMFPSLLTLDEDVSANSFPEIEIIGVASAVGQTKVASAKLAEWRNRGFVGGSSDDASGTDTAVVLADEALLMAALGHLPAGLDSVNVTMGFPMRLTPLAAVMHSVAALQRRARSVDGEPAFFYEDVVRILTQPVVRAVAPKQADTLMRDIAEKRIFTVSASLVAESYPALAPLFTPLGAEGRASLQATRDYFGRLIDLFALYADEKTRPVERRFLEAYRAALDELAEAFSRRSINMLETTMASLVERALATSTVNFTGEPLEGIQVMGMLETRSLDFDNIIITSMNEKVFPRRHARPSFIPEALRHAFGLPGKDAAEKDYGYYFYRLLTRARRVVLLYDARTEGVDRSGEMSRYLAQLVYLLPPGRVTHSTATFPPLSSSSAEPISIEKTPAVMQALDLFRREGSRKNLSASAINRYINCPLEFYLTAVCGLNFSSPSDGDDFIDSSTFGTIVHDVAENLYSSLAARSKDGIIKAETLRSSAVAAVVNPFVTSAVNRHYLRRVDPKDVEGGKKIPLKGLNRIQGRLIHDIVCRLMTAEADTFGDIPFVAAEYDFSGQVELAPGIRVNVRQVIDRIDRAGVGGSLRFVDYKTGSDDLRFPSIQAAFDPSREKRPKVLLQLLFYCLCYSEIEGYNEPVQPFVYLTRSLYSGRLRAPYFQEGRGPEEPILDYRPYMPEFRERLAEVVEEIFNPDIPFAAATSRPGYDGHCCRYCAFRQICNPPSKE